MNEWMNEWMSDWWKNREEKKRGEEEERREKRRNEIKKTNRIDMDKHWHIWENGQDDFVFIIMFQIIISKYMFSLPPRGLYH